MALPLTNAHRGNARAGRSRWLAAALGVFVAVIGSGCIAGMRRIGAEQYQTFRTMIVDACDGYRCRVHDGDVGNRAGVVLGVSPGPSFGPEPGRNTPVGYGASALAQFMAMTRVPRLALGGGVGFDSYSSWVDTDASLKGREQSALMTSFFDARAALRLAPRLSAHAGIGPAYGMYRLYNGDTTLGRIPWGWGGHLALGLDYLFRRRHERSAWGIRIESNTALLGGGTILGRSYHPLATTIGVQLIWLAGR